MKTNDIVIKLIDKKFKVMISDEFERMTDFWGFIKLLFNFSDFPHFTAKEKNNYFNKGYNAKDFYIDCNINCKIK